MSADEKARKVRERAHHLFLQRGQIAPGDALSDWFEAERQIELEDKDPRHFGPARLSPHHPHHRTLTDDSGQDLENPA